MKFCPNPQCPYYLEHDFVAEFEERVQHCLDCGALLVDEQPVFESLEMTHNAEPLSEMVLLQSQLMPAEAHILRGRLEAEGIPAFVADENVASFYLPQTFGGARLMVREGDWEKAVQILEQSSDNDQHPNQNQSETE